MYIRSSILRAAVLAFLGLFISGSSWADDERPSRYTPRTEGRGAPSQSSRWGDHLNKMSEQRSRPSSPSGGSIERNRGDSSQSGNPSWNRGNRDHNRSGSVDRSRSDTDQRDHRGSWGSSHTDRKHYGSYDRDRRKKWDGNRGGHRDHSRFSRGKSPYTYGSNHKRYSGSGRYHGNDRRDYFYFHRYNDPFYYNRYYGLNSYPLRSHSTILLGAAPLIYASSYRDEADSTLYGSSLPGHALFYEHSDLRGKAIKIRAGQGILDLKDHKKDLFTSFNDRISSLRVYGDVTVVLYTEAYFRGEAVYLYDSVYDFKLDEYLRAFNDEVTSIEVLAGRVDPNTRTAQSKVSEYGEDDSSSQARIHGFQPQTENSPPGRADNEDPGWAGQLETRTSSPVKQGTERVILYDQPDFKGNQIILLPGSSEPNLNELPNGSSTWDNAIGSIRIEGTAEVFIYTDAGYYGNGTAIDTSVPNFSASSALSPFAGTVSSVVVKSTK